MKDYDLNHYQCWYSIFEKIFSCKYIEHMLEFGLGNGTLFLADSVKSLHSVELAVSDNHEQWYNLIKSKLDSNTNWSSDIIICPKSIIESDITALKYKNHKHVDKSYYEDLRKIIEPFFEKEWDLVFIDPGIHLRGEIVKFCIEKKIPIIVTHDTEFPSLYGYDLIDHQNYEYLNFNTTHGTGLYLNKEYKENTYILEKLII